MGVGDYLRRQAEQRPEAPAAIHLEESLTYGRLQELASRFAGLLGRCGVRPGDRVALVLENGLTYLAAYFGVLRTGGVVVGLNPASTQRELSYIFGDCGVAAVVGEGRSGKLLRQSLVPSVRHLLLAGTESDALPEAAGTRVLALEPALDDARPAAEPPGGSPGDLAAIIYTSGTTGRPKGVMLTHRNLTANTESIVRYLELGPRDSVMAVLPFYYSYGHSLLLTHAAVGGCLVIDNRFAYPNKVLEVMEQRRVTGFSGVPSTYAILVHKSSLARYDLSSLRYLTQAGGPMAPALALELRRRLPHARLFIMYGQTEASARLSYLPPHRLDDKPGSIGIAIPGVELRLLDAQGRPVPVGEVGEIVARGENIMAGYWGSPEETGRVLRPEGLRTGDLARADEEGFFYIVSRQSDMIKSGAHRISPKEIEEILAGHPAVFESAVIGVEDPILGEAIVAVVVLREGAHPAEKELLAFCKRNLPPHKVPRTLRFRAELPKTSSGKVRRGILREEEGGRGPDAGTLPAIGPAGRPPAP